MTREYKTVRRDMLLRRLKEGRIVAQCTLSLTDDYQFDDANDMGRSVWLVARLKTWIVTHPATETQPEIGRMDFVEGMMNLAGYHFEGKSGRAHRLEGTNRISLKVHSNLYYDLAIVPEGVDPKDFAISLNKLSIVRKREGEKNAKATTE